MLNQTITKSLLVLLTIGFYTSNNFAAKRNIMGRESDKQCAKECTEVFAAWQKVLNEKEKALKKTEIFLTKKIKHIEVEMAKLEAGDGIELSAQKRECISHKIQYLAHTLKLLEIKRKLIKESMKLIPLKREFKIAKEKHIHDECELMEKIDKHCMKNEMKNNSEHAK